MVKLKGCIIDSANIYAPTTLPTGGIDAIVSGLAEADLLGISESGVSISCIPEVRDIPHAGAKERRIKGGSRILKWDIKCEGEIIVLNEKILKANLLNKVTGETSSKFDKYTPATTITNDNYINLVIVGDLHETGEPCVAVITDCINYEGLVIETKDKDEGKSKMVFEGNYSGDKVPYDLYLPKPTVGA